MAFDGITTYHLVSELKKIIVNGRIRKVYQPDNDEIRLVVNHISGNYTLLLSANANNPRAYITEKKKSNPETPPNFCMALRKHLVNGVIENVRQYKSDRILILDISSKNEFNERTIKSLIVEIMGRNSNIILVSKSGEDEAPVIIDCLKKVGSTSSRYRQILPGLDYKTPPEEGRSDYFSVDSEDKFIEWLSDHRDKKLSDALVRGFLGVSPNLAREICYRAGIDSEHTAADLGVKQTGYLSKSFMEIQKEILAGAAPVLYYFRREIQDFSTVDLHQFSTLSASPQGTVSEMLESYYYQKDKKSRFKTRSANLRHRLSALYKKNLKKLQNLQQDYLKTQGAGKNKLYGDLITANIYQIKKGMKSVTLPDYNDPEMKPVTVPLKVNETPSQNAQRYYKKYNKAKRGQVQLTEQIAKTKEQVYYLESLLNALDQSTELNELEEIRHEVAHSEFAKQAPGKKDHRPLASTPLHYRSSEGFDIYVGKNNYQNDEISTRMGTDEDCWLHVKDIPGSHVLIVADGKFITEQTVIEGGELAAYYSQARNSQNVPVDYVEYKYVHKPKKAKPGMVIFTNQNTMYVTPRREDILKLELIENDD